MYQDDTNQRPQENEEDKPYTFSDEDTKKKIQRHLRDINDVISENDIANVKVPGEEDGNKENIPEDTNKKPTEGAEGKPATPWDLVD